MSAAAATAAYLMDLPGLTPYDEGLRLMHDLAGARDQLQQQFEGARAQPDGLAEALEVGRAIFAPMRMEMRPWLPTT